MSQNRLHELIGKLLKGKISREEFEVLNAWYEDNQNKSHIEILSPFSKEELKNRLKSKINNKITKRKYRINKLAIPAAALILIAFSIFFFQDKNNDLHLNKNEFFAESQNQEVKEIYLPDSSLVILNSQSSIRYTENKNSRNLSLNGEAFFEVKRNEKLPFIINMDLGEVKVLGTSFNVFQDNDFLNVAVKSGLVSVIVKNDENKYLLSPDKELSYNKNQGLVVIDSSQINNSFGWYDYKLTFEETPLNIALKRFERWYDIEFEMQKKLNFGTKINASFEDVELAEAVKSLEFILDSKIIIEKNKLVIK